MNGRGSTAGYPEHQPAPETIERVFALLRSYPQPFSTPQWLLADELDMSRTNLIRAVKVLREQGRVEVVRKGTGPGFPTTYRVAPEETP